MDKIAFVFFVLFIIYFSFSIVMHWVAFLKKRRELMYMVSSFYARSIIFLGPASLLFIKDISWSVYTTGPLKVLILPLLYLFFKKLSSPDKTFLKKDIMHLLPFFFEILFTLPIAFFHAKDVVDPTNINLQQIFNITWDGHFFYNMLALTARSIAFVQSIVYAFLISKLYRTIELELLDQTSYISYLNLNWINWVTYILIINAFFSGIELFGLYSYPIFFILAFVFLIFSAFFFIIHSVTHREVASGLTDQYQPVINRTNDSNSDQEAFLLVLEEFTHKELYLLPDINLRDAAYQLCIAKYKLTNYIKMGGYDNFYHFVNHLRVNKSKELLETISPQHSIEYVVSEAGFNSRSTFYRVFKDYCGLTPTEYIKKISS